MRWIDTLIGSRLEPCRRIAGKVAECEDCGSRYFCAFVVGEKSHLHLQCARCGEVFCGGEGPCAADGLVAELPTHDPLEDGTAFHREGEVPS